ncbi:hypothetical protein FVEG_03804 [Fusarium verticillioides 7600]|uniref:Siderophore biosynthesis enzyme n=2 Tax=Fusarium TaxID=5506 RepID=W7M2J2_GIBM7|nr:hypothetical protein FVEG_03804 [Fusarium verticillioides 7600]XP_044682854.1 hypothetical protein J7337_003812 [Fusarium musae]RBQ67390.1 hypothetical protein FVER14953_03804 [Fusarium verticillioides]EWG41780.1 hypothetical protein FVEG_03804 [Fusarium verticillioides 7600]KAG9503854.1 hypothetical protein J7337_003812 [Fusarium musae]RBQ97030.1 hypothetical protein FVER53263_03804 [Fusarium verticillioides]RBR07058.1 hypothetical protein FVER53590_03804 [Fusarium verticillioides]
MAAKFLTAALIAAVPVLAKTDLAGCTSYDTVLSNANGMYASRIWYVPDTGELCDFLDCGGGRAPPKTTVPGCPGYVGTATYSPLFINPKTLGGAVPEETGDSSPTSTEDGVSESATITAAPTTETEESASTTEAEPETESETKSKDDEETSTDKAKDTKTITTLATHATPSASSGAETGSAAASASGSDSHSVSHSDSSSETDAAATPASTVSTAGAVMPTAGAFLALAGAAMYAGML